MIVYPHWSLVKVWPWRSFTPAELADRTTGKLVVVDSFLDRLQRMRTEYGKPMVITSGYRTPEHNAEVSATGSNGPHTTGRAVDFLVGGGDNFTLVALAMKVGMTGIGLKQHGPLRGRYMHVDDLAPEDVGSLENPLRPRIWTYA